MKIIADGSKVGADCVALVIVEVSGNHNKLLNSAVLRLESRASEAFKLGRHLIICN